MNWYFILAVVRRRPVLFLRFPAPPSPAPAPEELSPVLLSRPPTSHPYRWRNPHQTVPSNVEAGSHSRQDLVRAGRSFAHLRAAIVLHPARIARQTADAFSLFLP